MAKPPTIVIKLNGRTIVNIDAMHLVRSMFYNGHHTTIPLPGMHAELQIIDGKNERGIPQEVRSWQFDIQKTEWSDE